MSENFPVGQFWQDDDAIDSENLPASHKVQSIDPIEDEYDGGWQDKQLVVPLVFVYDPTEQFVHCETAARLE